MRAICRIDDSTACYVWVPRNEIDAEYAMQPRSLRCQVPNPLVAAIRVESAVRWRLLQLLNNYRALGNVAVSEVSSNAQART